MESPESRAVRRLIMAAIWGFPADLATGDSGWLSCSAIPLRRERRTALPDRHASGSQPLLAAWRTTSTRLLNPSFSMARAL